MFDLSDALIRQIIFAMENQNIRYVVDAHKGVLVRLDTLSEHEQPRSLEQLDPQERYHPLPTWTSADGFYFMEGFVAELRNPTARAALLDILESGKRVFRRFKDELKQFPQIERRFYSRKFLHMRAVVLAWYNELREVAGMDAIELGVDEEIEDLVLSDVTIEEVMRAAVGVISELDRRAFYESYADCPDELVHYLYERRRAVLPGPEDARSIVLAAFSPMEELCGFLWTTVESATSLPQVFALRQLYVQPEYRGLGIASSLLERTVAVLRERGDGPIISELPGTFDPVHSHLERLGFRDLGRESVLTGG